jgi:hypothetical protein
MRKSDPKAAAAPAADNRTRPVSTLRLGRIKAAIWENKVDDRSYYNVTFSRTYKDEQEQFHDSDSFGRDDLLLVAKLADQAHSFIFDRMKGDTHD